VSTQIFLGDCRDILAELGDSSVDSIVTDPPYELAFMGKKWDGTGIAFDVKMWGECLRALKPGGHLLAFGGSRTWHRLAVAIEDSGFELRDSIAWLYSQGFHKSKTVLKPAFEPVVVARKPFKGSEKANVDSHGTGALNIDACRTATADTWAHTRRTDLGVMNDDGWQPKITQAQTHASGRWPTNVALEDSAAAELDTQSGILTSGKVRAGGLSGDYKAQVYGKFARNEIREETVYGDSGGASRFFPVFKYQAKAPTKERPKVNGVSHPTVKPLELIRWLTRLVTPLGGTVLDPFAGSGTTAEACLLEGFDCIAIESEPDYIPLIEQRLERAR
jgi:site-specific DNA-methyltransferase (adenine-specific)